MAMKKRLLTLALVPTVLIGGCTMPDASAFSGSADEAQVKLEQTITPDSKWINSSIPGAIDENTDVRLQDDFYTAVNKDWILSTSLESDYGMYYERADDIIKNRKIMIVSGEEDPEANETSDVEISPESIEHDEELLKQFVSAVTDWDKRNEIGRKPLEEYIDAIKKISSISEMNDYIADRNGDNFTNDFIISMEVSRLSVDPSTYNVILGRKSHYLLDTRDQYVNINSSGVELARIVENEVITALTGINYSESEARKILKKCYRFEERMADASLPDLVTNNAERMGESEDFYTLDEVKNMQGNYPLAELMNIYGFDKASQYYVPYTDFVKKIGSMYNESNLEEIKAYYIVHTIHEAMTLLDKESYDIAKEYQKLLDSQITIKMKNPDGDTRKIEINDEWDSILQEYVAKYLQEPLEIVYISRYCTAEEKAYLTDITNQIVEYYVQMLSNEEWLDEAARNSAIEKLNYMNRRILYPDYFNDFSNLIFEDDDTILDMVKKAKKSNYCHDALQAGKKVGDADWDLLADPTTTVNAYYLPGQNTINIFAGINAGSEVFDLDKPYEWNLGRIGAIIGHEITHGFDSNGTRFDKYGRDQGIWKAEERSAFDDRARALEKYYGTLSSAPGLPNLSGSKVKDEVIADMGGMKACLGIASKTDGFDYDMFFRSFAGVWCCKETYAEVMLSNKSDEHPVGCLRANVTVSQFDEFINTYDIKEGDGMYVAPDKRIAVW